MLGWRTVFASLALAGAQAASVPLFMWAGDDSTYGGQSVYVLETVNSGDLASVILPADAVALPEVVVAYVGDHLSADEVADHVRSGRMSTLPETLKSAASSKIAPYTVAAQGVGQLAAALAQLTNRTQPGGMFHAVAGALNEHDLGALSSHVAGWRPAAVDELVDSPMWSNGVVDVVAVFFGGAAKADAAIEATETALEGVAGKYVSVLTAAKASAQRPTRVVHFGAGARQLMQAGDDAAAADKVDYVYGSSNYLCAMIVFTFMLMIVLQATCCLIDIQTPTKYWTDATYTVGKVDE